MAVTAYADYSFYNATYLGTAIASADFSRLALRASKIIDQLTYNRAADIMASEDTEDADNQEAIEHAVCAVADEVQKLEESGGAVASESIGRHSVTYAAPETEWQKYTKAAKLYLADTGLMFPGQTLEERVE